MNSSIFKRLSIVSLLKLQLMHVLLGRRGTKGGMTDGKRNGEMDERRAQYMERFRDVE